MGNQASHFEAFDRLVESTRGLDAEPLPPVPPEDIAEELISLLAPNSFAADQYRTLRHSIELLRRECDLRVIAMTSATPGDGKSITTLNLAGALAQRRDARVLVIDADLRRPSVANYLGLDRHALSPGLSDVLRDPAFTLNRVVRRLDGFNLSAVPAGAPQDSPYELLNSPRLESFLNEARELYDCVLVDTPPLVPLPDCRIIGKWVDGFLLIVGAHKTPKKLVLDALNLLDPAKVIGVVYNGDKRPVSAYYGYHYYSPRGDERGAGWWRRVLARGRAGRDARR